MARGEYRGVNGVARKVVAEYRGVNGIARRVVKAYRGVSGIARQHFGYPLVANFITGISDTNNDGYVTLNDAFAGADNGNWRFYVNATSTMPDNGNSAVGSDTNRAYAYVRFSDYEFEGKSVTLTYTSNGSLSYIDAGIYFYNGDERIFDQLLGDVTNKTITVDVPDGTTKIVMGVNCGRQGTHSIELIVHALSIGDEVIL